MLQQRLTMMIRRLSPYATRALFGVLAALLALLPLNDRNFRPLRNKAEWKTDANYSKAGARFAVDRDLETWWSSYYAMTFGMWMQVDVGKPVTLNGIVLHVKKADKEAQPKEWVVKVSRDGKEWRSARTRDGAIDGTLLLIPFEAVSAQYVQIIQTSIATTPSPWRIYELDLLQPAVPWQFARSTLISVIIGWLCIMIAVFVFRQRSLCFPLHSRFAFSEPATPVNALVATVIIAAVMVIGWGLSVYQVEYDALSAHESQYVRPTAFDRHSTGEWILAYFHHSKTGAYWLSLLAVRLTHDLCQSQLAAFRLIPALFGVGSMLLLFLTWRAVSQSRLAIWEALVAAAMFGFAGWTILLHRTGDFSAALIFWLLLEVWLSHQALHGRHSSWLFGVFSIVSVLGICFHPGLLLFPVGVCVFEVWHLWLCAYAPNWLQSSHLQAYRLPNRIRKIAAYLVALLPMLAYGMFAVSDKSQLFQIAPANVGMAVSEFSDALRGSGLSGIAAMIFFSMATLGLVYFLSERSHGEWFFMTSGSIFAICLALASPEYHHAASAVLLLLLTMLCAKGATGTVAFLTPRHAERPRQTLFALCLVLLAGYMGVAAANTLFWGSARVPYDSQAYAEQQTRRRLRTLTEAIHADPNDCKTIAAFTEQDKEMLASMYRLPVGVAQFQDLRRVAKQGIFVTYLAADAISAARPEVADFLREYYNELGASAPLTIYHVRDEFRNQPQRYYPDDLFANTGRTVQDAAAVREIAREATVADSPGLLSFGPFCRVCQPGRYLARFALRINEPADEAVATLSVVEGNAELPGRKTLTGRDLFPAGKYHLIDLPFTVDFSDAPAYRMKRYQFFTQTTGNADTRLNYIELQHDNP